MSEERAGDTAGAAAASPLSLGTAEFFRELLVASGDALVTVDGSGTIVFATPALEELLGYEPVEVIGSSLDRLVPGVDPGDDGDCVARHVSGDDLPVSVQFRDHTFEGQALVTATIDPIDAGADDHRRELRERTQSIETILSNVPAVLFTLDGEGVFTRSEGQPLAEIGLEPGEAIGQSVFDLYADYPEILDVCRRALDGETVTHTADVQGRIFETTYRPVVESGTVEMVVGFAYDITEREQRERQLERQGTTLRRIKQVTDGLRPLNRALARASTRTEIEQAVCEQLATADPYRFAWYGRYDPDRDRVTPREWCGIEDAYFEEGGPEAVHQCVRTAVGTGEVETLRRVPTDPDLVPLREDALARGYGSVAAIPVAFEETVYGAVAVYSSRPDAFDEYERGLFRELGERVGHAVHAADNERLLHTDTVVELEFRLTDSPLVALADELGCRLELETLVPATDGELLCYLAVEDGTPGAVLARLRELPLIEEGRVVTAAGTTGTVEVRVRAGPMTTLRSHGAAVTSYVVEPGRERFVAEVPPEADVSRIITGVRRRHEDVTFVAKRSVDRSVQRLDVTDDALREILTDRQREVLALAYHAGFFQSPRKTTGDELAESLGIASPTFYLHVRKATQRLLAEIDRLGLLRT